MDTPQPQPDDTVTEDLTTAADDAVSDGTVSVDPGIVDDGPSFRIFALKFSGPGMLLALLFFAFSLYESLLPRTGLFQGVVSGITVAIGYGIGALGQWLWRYLGIPRLRGRVRTISSRVMLVLLGFIVLSAMWGHVGWQNGVRELMGMDAVTPVVWLTIVPVTIAVAAVLLIITRSLGKLFYLFFRWLSKVFSDRFARVIGAIALGLVVWLFFTGVLETSFFAAANRMFEPRDTKLEQEIEQPVSALRSGSPDSASEWETLGRKGRAFVATGPTVDDLNSFSGGGAVEPVRVYVGLKAAETIQGRAQLALQELIKTGAFDRKILVVATTTGTGFLDENAVDPLEYLYNGDTAIVGVQYSYLPSWISLLADKEVTRETSRVVFDTIHSYWSTLPEETRPRIYLYGLSLGSFGVESILTSINIINEPIDGAFMAGPPFVNDLHKELTTTRDPGSAASLPLYQEGRTVRFTAKENALDVPTATWEDTKIVYLQHASDPVVFFSWDLALNEPDWLLPGQRGPDVSPDMVWVPIVTMWQVALDLPAAGTTPEGFAHLYTTSENLDGWIGITQPEGWSDADTAALKAFLEQG